MIESKELRFGNYVNEEVLGDCKVSGILKETVWVEVNNIKSNGSHNLRDFRLNIECLEPILLTEEWIKDLGLIKVIGWDDMVFWRLPEDKNLNDCFELMETLQGYELPSGKICEFVHQLQNCYFFHELTGKELTLNK